MNHTSPLVYSYDVLSVYSGLLYLSFPIIVTFHHEEHSINLFEKFSDLVNEAVSFLSRKTKKWKNIQMFFQA